MRIVHLFVLLLVLFATIALSMDGGSSRDSDNPDGSKVQNPKRGLEQKLKYLLARKNKVAAKLYDATRNLDDVENRFDKAPDNLRDELAPELYSAREWHRHYTEEFTKLENRIAEVVETIEDGNEAGPSGEKH